MKCIWPAGRQLRCPCASITLYSQTGCLVFPNSPWKDDGNINTKLVTSQLWSSCFNSCQTSPQSVVYPLQQKRMTECKNEAWQPKWLHIAQTCPRPNLLLSTFNGHDQELTENAFLRIFYYLSRLCNIPGSYETNVQPADITLKALSSRFVWWVWWELNETCNVTPLAR